MAKPAYAFAGERTPVRTAVATASTDAVRIGSALTTTEAMAAAIGLSRAHGIGCVALANTNHWMRGGTYGWQAADAGCVAICWTNTLPNLPPWGADMPRIGNNPLVIAVPRAAGHVVFDIAMSQFSYGALESYRKRGELLPVDGGFDAAESLVAKLWEARLRTKAPPLRDPKTVLQEWAQARGMPTPVYREIARSGPHHDPEFRVAVQLPQLAPAEGSGRSKRAAEQAAAAALMAREGFKSELLDA